MGDRSSSGEKVLTRAPQNLFSHGRDLDLSLEDRYK